MTKCPNVLNVLQQMGLEQNYTQHMSGWLLAGTKLRGNAFRQVHVHVVQILFVTHKCSGISFDLPSLPDPFLMTAGARRRGCVGTSAKNSRDHSRCVRVLCFLLVW